MSIGRRGLAAVVATRLSFISTISDNIDATLRDLVSPAAAIAHRPDGSPMLTGVSGLHISLSHAHGTTAFCVSEKPVGIDLVEVEDSPENRLVAAELFTPREREWLAARPAASWGQAFACLWAVKEAVAKRGRRGLGTHDLPRLDALLAAMPSDFAETAASGSAVPLRHLTGAPIGIACWRAAGATLLIAIAMTPGAPHIDEVLLLSQRAMSRGHEGAAT